VSAYPLKREHYSYTASKRTYHASASPPYRGANEYHIEIRCALVRCTLRENGLSHDKGFDFECTSAMMAGQSSPAPARLYATIRNFVLRYWEGALQEP